MHIKPEGELAGNSYVHARERGECYFEAEGVEDESYSH